MSYDDKRAKVKAAGDAVVNDGHPDHGQRVDAARRKAVAAEFADVIEQLAGAMRDGNQTRVASIRAGLEGFEDAVVVQAASELAAQPAPVAKPAGS